MSKPRYNFVDITGRTFGELTVIRQDGYTKTRGVVWLCECSCGGTARVASNGLTSGNNKTCRAQIHRRSERVGEIPLVHLNAIKQNAIKRGFVYSLTPEWLWRLFEKQNRRCALSGVPLQFTDKHDAHKGRGETTASLDRIDPNKGYTKNNVQWLHKDVNRMKWTCTDKEFLEWCRKCIAHNDNTHRPGWDEYFLRICSVVQQRSEDPHTHVGCVIVGPDNQIVSTGYNALPFGVGKTVERLERPTKYAYIEHGDRNAIYLAARLGVPLNGCKMYLTGIPCMDCARGIIQVGIVEVIYDGKRQEEWVKTTPKYGPDFEMVKILFKEAGVKLIEWRE